MELSKLTIHYKCGIILLTIHYKCGIILLTIRKGDNMKVAGYICENCSYACDFKEDDIRETYICPECGNPMWYLSSYEIDENTGLTIGDSWFDTSREKKSPAPFSSPTPTTPIPNQYVPKCPTCGSPDVEKISLTSKVVGGALFGLFSSNVRKTMRCKNCGYKW